MGEDQLGMLSDVLDGYTAPTPTNEAVNEIDRIADAEDAAQDTSAVEEVVATAQAPQSDVTAPKEEPEQTEQKKEEPSSEVASLKAEIEGLKQLILQQAAQTNQQQQQPVQQEPEIEVVSFATAEEVQEALNDPQKFNELLGKVYKQARIDTLKDLPQLVATTAQRQMTIQQTINKFWSDNKDFEAVKPYVLFKAREIEAANPGKSYEEILNLVEQAVRADLKLTKQAVEIEQKRQEKKKPAFANGTRGNGGQSAPVERNAQQRQIDELLV